MLTTTIGPTAVTVLFEILSVVAMPLAPAYFARVITPLSVTSAACASQRTFLHGTQALSLYRKRFPPQRLAKAGGGGVGGHSARPPGVAQGLAFRQPNTFCSENSA